MKRMIGIDIGTSNVAAAILIDGKPTIIPSVEGTSIGGKAFPSIVAFAKDGQILVGKPAKSQRITNPDRTIMEINRKIGTDYIFKIDGKKYPPSKIYSILLEKIRDDARIFLGENVTDALISVPAYFNYIQRGIIKKACNIAGLNNIRIITDSTAAALVYMYQNLDKELKLMVIDFGGGKFDISIMDIGEGVVKVESKSGDTQLGGIDIDNLIINWIVTQFQKKEKIEVRGDSIAMMRIKEAAENAKIELSSALQTDISLPYIKTDNIAPKNLNLTLTRKKMEKLIDPILKRLNDPIRIALEDAAMGSSQIDKIILVGGSTRMPCIRAKFKEILGRTPEAGIDPMECIAMGAAIQAAVMEGEIKEILLLDATPLTLGIETAGGISSPLIARNTTIPTKKSEIFSTTNDNQKAIEIHVLQGERKMAKNNLSLARFHLFGILPAPKGVPQIEVTFDIDANDILNVSAKDLGTGKTEAITLSTSFSESEWKWYNEHNKKVNNVEIGIPSCSNASAKEKDHKKEPYLEKKDEKISKKGKKEKLVHNYCTSCGLKLTTYQNEIYCPNCGNLIADPAKK
ncbi:MAG: Hsp70 family protein [Promethearchaeota archaeon]